MRNSDFIDGWWTGSAFATATLIAGELIREGNLLLRIPLAFASVYWLIAATRKRKV